MARKNREINVFNLSFLDVLSCALGAVILVLVLIPDPKPTKCPDPKPCPVCRECPTCPVCQQCPTPKPCPVCQECPTCPDCKEDVAILISISWKAQDDRKVDIDLHVEPPGGYPEIYYRNKETKRNGILVMKLTHDNTGGAHAPEVFFSPRAPEGDWTIYVKYYAGSASTEVKGTIYWAEGEKPFNTQYMSRKGEKRRIATLTVKKGKLLNLQMY